MDKDTLNAIMCALSGTSVMECEIAAKGGTIRIVRDPVRINPPAAPPPSVPESETLPEEDADTVDITSSWVGYFYRGATKDAKPCVRLRDMVKEGQQIGSVNTMNVFQDLTSPASGRLIEFLAEDGQAVEYGQPLVRLRIDEQDAP